MLIVGIESSCDETAVAVLDQDGHVLSSEVASQVAVHQPFGGVVPEIAAREHLSSIEPLFLRALENAQVNVKALGLVAVTQGPGLMGALLTGISFAKALAFRLKLPIQPVDHVHAHIHGALLDLPAKETPKFPALALVVSGGHTNLYFMKTPTTFRLLGSTIDDACGECFDKVGKLLNLPYPAGAAIEQLASKGRPGTVQMPKMMRGRKDLNFSYSGLKTHTAYWMRDHKNDLSEQDRADLCHAFQEEAIRQLGVVVQRAGVQFKNEIKSVIIAGGVSANQRFKDIMSTAVDVPVIFPQLKYCSDNAAMIAALGYAVYTETTKMNHIDATNSSWDAYSRYRFNS